MGGFYDVHMDASDFQPRHATLLCYLRSPAVGGETVFPLAGMQSQSAVSLASFDEARTWLKQGEWVGTPCGLSVAPVAGDAVLWYNLSESGSPDFATCHAALAVGSGEKWVANLWTATEL